MMSNYFGVESSGNGGGRWREYSAVINNTPLCAYLPFSSQLSLNIAVKGKNKVQSEKIQGHGDEVCCGHFCDDLNILNTKIYR